MPANESELPLRGVKTLIYQQRARDLLDTLNAIADIKDLRTPPSNRLHKLKGDLKDFWSIRIINQWRIIFKWNGTSVYDVEIIDYHNQILIYGMRKKITTKLIASRLKMILNKF